MDAHSESNRLIESLREQLMEARFGEANAQDFAAELIRQKRDISDENNRLREENNRLRSENYDLRYELHKKRQPPFWYSTNNIECR